MTLTAIIDYGVGNIFSLFSSFAFIGEEAALTSSPEEIRSADRVILPGVGAFADARKKLADTGLDKVVIDLAGSGKPLMGICLGMQLLFDRSFEYGVTQGLGLIHGDIVPIEAPTGQKLKIPHIGWNALEFAKENKIFSKIENGDFVYFVHSFYADNCEADTIAVTEYGHKLTAAVANDNIFGMQFHPEKSGEIGLNILRAFCEV